jgi:TamB, inner membrane protein subunit of TAM complex
MEVKPDNNINTMPNEFVSITLQKTWYLLRLLWRRVENIVFFVILLLIGLYFLLQSTVVQNWLIQKTTAYLSEELQTTVKISHIDVAFFDNLVLDNFFIADQKGDTLLYAGKLKAGLNSNIFQIISSKLEFDEIGLADTYIHIKREAGNYDDNLQFILDWLPKTKKGGPYKPKPPFVIKVKNLNIDNLRLIQEDYVKGRKQAIWLPKGNMRINKFDAPSKEFDIQSIFLDGLVYDFEDYESKPLPPRPVKVELEDKTIVDTSKTQYVRKLMNAKVHSFNISGARLDMDKFHISPKKETSPTVLDVNHLSIDKINLIINELVFDDNLVFSGEIKHFAAREQCGFEVIHSEVKKAYLSDSLTTLHGLKLETEHSVLGDTFEMRYKTYRDFLSFNNNIDMRGVFQKSTKICLGELIHFNESLSKNSFFIKNKEEYAIVSGQLNGFVNKLRGKDLSVQLGKSTFAKLDFRGDNLARSMDIIDLGLTFKSLQSNVKTLRDLIPGFTAPPVFNKLGSFNYEGGYNLIFGYNHIIKGKLLTEVGNGDVDINIDLTNGKEKATYSGKLDMYRFDLAAWTGNNDFGKATFKVKIVEGSSGLTLPTINANFSGGIDTISFKGYTYSSLQMGGKFNRKLFDGNFGIDDPNLSFKLDGTINFQDTIPVFNFNADVKKIDLGALNLLNKDWVISGKIDRLNLKGKTPEDIAGNMYLRNIKIIQDKFVVHDIDSISFNSLTRPDGSRYFGIQSEVGAGHLDGKYNLATIPAHLKTVFSRYYPEFAQQLGVFSDTNFVTNDNYFFNLYIINTKNLTKLAGVGLDTLKSIQAIGRIDEMKGLSNINIEVPNFKINNIGFEQTSMVWNGVGDKAEFDFSINKTILGKDKNLAPIRVYGKTKSNLVDFNVTAQNFNSILKNINLSGSFSTVDSVWQVKFNPSDITLFNESWFMDENNYVRFGKKEGKSFFATQNFDLFNQDKRIFLDSLGGKGLRLGLTNFDLNFINNFVKVKDVTYRGKIYDFDLAIQDAFLFQGVSLYINTDTLFIKDQPYGYITGNMDMDDLSAPLTWKLSVVGNEHRLKLTGGWLSGGDNPREIPEIGTIKPKEIQLQTEATHFPMNVLQQFIPGISKTMGNFDANVRLGGPFSRLGMKGEVNINEGAFQIDYLKAPFYIKNQRILLSDYAIWADGDTVYDGSQQNMALIRGGLRHDHFSQWRIDCSINSTSDNFLILNTTKEDNTSYYGQGIGRVNANFSGTFSRTDILINAITGRGSRLYIPLESVEDAQAVSFIKFKVKASDSIAVQNKAKNFQISDLKGLNFEMNLSLTEEAEVQMIFDEQAGDIIKGKGIGNINLVINRDGAFKMYGDYTIKKGEYLFTLLNVVAKPFTVAEGTINWFGDPYTAQINLNASYDINTPIYNFLADELELVASLNTNDVRVREAKKSTNTNVKMRLTGELFKPNVSFNLEFPNLASEVKSLADNKLRSLRQDPNELNRQVFGLIVVGSFLRSNTNSLFQGSAANAGINTVSQMLSSQFSNYLTSLASDIFGNSVSSFDFNIGYNAFSDNLNAAQSQDELQVRMSTGLKNDRYVIKGGAQFGVRRGANLGNNNGLIGQDVAIEISLNKSKQWRIKIYERTEPDYTGSALRTRFGIGFSFDREYDSFEDMLLGVKRKFGKPKI